MKRLTYLAALGLLAGCSDSADVKPAPANTQDPFVQKLQSMPESERAEYARQHAQEAMQSANGGGPGAPK